MSAKPTFVDIIRRWPTMADLADDLDLPYERVKMWRVRNSIRAKYWPAIVDAAARRGYVDITTEVLTMAAAGHDDDTDSHGSSRFVQRAA